MESSNQLGEYLRSRRELLTPDDVGLPSSGRRRVRGLRREETALLAGISVEDYLRIEQGLDRSPSDEVLDRLAAALRLDADATAHLHRIAHPASGRRRAGSAPDLAGTDAVESSGIGRGPVGESLVALIEAWSGQAAVVRDGLMDVLASNALARALGPGYSPGENLLRTLFLDPASPTLHRDWEELAARSIAGLRAIVGPELDDPRLAQLVGDLSLRSERFRQLWASPDVRPTGGGTALLRHPLVGELDLRYEKFGVEATAGQVLVVFHAEPGTPSDAAMRRLSAIARGETHQDSHRSLVEPIPIDSRRHTGR